MRAWSILAGLALGALVIPAVLNEWTAWRDRVRNDEDRNRPVITTQTQIVGRGSGYVVVHIVGEKLRNCAYKGLQAYMIDEAGRMRTTEIERVSNGMDVPQGTTRPVGPFDAGKWRIAVDPHRRAVVYAAYDCEQSVVLSIFATVPHANQ